MVSTHESLLTRLRDTADHAAWRDFDRRYGGLVLAYALRRGLGLADAEDVRQSVLLNLARTFPSFVYDRASGRFRDYLGAAVRNAISRHRSRHAVPDRRLPEDAAAAAAPSPAHDEWEQQWRRHHCTLALDSLRRSESPRNLEVLSMLLAGGQAPHIADALGLRPEAVRKIKQRLWERLRALVAAQLSDEHPGGSDEGG